MHGPLTRDLATGDFTAVKAVSIEIEWNKDNIMVFKWINDFILASSRVTDNQSHTPTIREHGPLLIIQK